MEEQFVRTAYLLGDEAVERLKRSSVILFGVGGVGSFCAEALARAGIGKLCLVDPDAVSESNLNRQLVALRSTIGRNKAEVMKERIADINPLAEVTAMSLFYLPENADSVDLSAYDVVIDAVDTVSAKIELAVRANALGVPVVSAMGAGNKLHPEMFEISDLAKTSVCPLARVMRTELKKRGIVHMRVVYSKEIPRELHPDYKEGKACPLEGRRQMPGSISFVPSAAGLLLAAEAIRLLAEKK